MYDAFAATIAAIGNYNQPIDTIITFNYDLIVDYAIARIDNGNYAYYADYALPGNYSDFRKIKSNSKPIKLLKLHGSANWLRCSECDNKYVMPEDKSIAQQSVTSYMHHLYVESVSFCCGPNGKYKPIIIPPAWNKPSIADIKSSVWKTAIQELQEAERIIVIGYSFPDQDGFFRYLLSLGMSIDIDKFILFELPNSDAVKRYQKCFQGKIKNFQHVGEFQPTSLHNFKQYCNRP